MVKNKLSPGLNQTAEFTFICGKGIDPTMDLISYAKDTGLIRFAGSAVKLNLPEEEEYTMCTGGMNGAKSYFAQNPEVYSRVKEHCYKLGGIERAESSNTESL